MHTVLTEKNQTKKKNLSEYSGNGLTIIFFIHVQAIL